MSMNDLETIDQSYPGLTIDGSHYDGEHPCNPSHPINHNMPLWCVMGPKCFPTLFCCRISTKTGKPVVWGYSVYEDQPGFRTLGIALRAYMEAHPEALFYRVQKDALARIYALTSPMALPDATAEEQEVPGDVPADEQPERRPNSAAVAVFVRTIAEATRVRDILYEHLDVAHMLSETYDLALPEWVEEAWAWAPEDVPETRRNGTVTP